MLFEEVARRGGNLGGLTRGLIPLLDRFGADALQRAITEALEHDTPHLSALRHILDRNRHEQGKPPPIAVELPDNPKVRDLVVNPHSLTTYDQLRQEDNADDKPQDPEP
jgi:hypothetical protein